MKNAKNQLSKYLTSKVYSSKDTCDSFCLGKKLQLLTYFSLWNIIWQ